MTHKKDPKRLDQWWMMTDVGNGRQMERDGASGQEKKAEGNVRPSSLDKSPGGMCHQLSFPPLLLHSFGHLWGQYRDQRHVHQFVSIKSYHCQAGLFFLIANVPNSQHLPHKSSKFFYSQLPCLVFSYWEVRCTVTVEVGNQKKKINRIAPLNFPWPDLSFIMNLLNEMGKSWQLKKT